MLLKIIVWLVWLSKNNNIVNYKYYIVKGFFVKLFTNELTLFILSMIKKIQLLSNSIYLCTYRYFNVCINISWSIKLFIRHKFRMINHELSLSLKFNSKIVVYWILNVLLNNITNNKFRLNYKNFHIDNT